MTQDDQLRVLFLQGPMSPYFQKLADVLVARGHLVERINVCAGDRLFWRRHPASNYKGRLEDWPAFVGGVMDRFRPTHLMFLGDQRPRHIAAADEARVRGIEVMVTELGYLRPDWITLERDGMSGQSRFPNTPDAFRRIARQVDEPDMAVRYYSSFFKFALWDVAYNLLNVFAWWRYPHYRGHSVVHPLVEYAGWIFKLAKRPLTRSRTQRDFRRLMDQRMPFYLFPLQLETDYQIRAHSPYATQSDAIAEIMTSFAQHAPANSRLVIKVHPLDNELKPWRREIRRMAGQRGIAERVDFLNGGDLDALLSLSAGVVTINSTVGTMALQSARPLLVLGRAVFDAEGLSFQGGIDRFWSQATPPDPAICDDFIRAMAATIQVKGGFYGEEPLRAAVSETLRRLEGGLVNMPDGYLDAAPRAGLKLRPSYGVVEIETLEPELAHS